MNNEREIGTPSGLVVFGALAGVLSSLIFPLGMPAGALLGGCLAYGVTRINRRQAGPLSAGDRPTWDGVWETALRVGAIPALLIGGIYASFEFDQPGKTLFPWPSAMAAMVYALTLLPAYHARWRVGYGWAFVLILIGGVLGGMARGSFFPGIESSEVPIPRSGFIYIFGVMGGLPFAAFWGLAMYMVDPAFTFKRWKRRLALSTPGD